jgi:chromosome segregation ATPase
MVIDASIVSPERAREAMTERNTVKMKRTEDAKSAARKPSSRDLEGENARLRAELATAQQRIAELEQRTTDALNRIDWVVDSLHTLEESKGS